MKKNIMIVTIITVSFLTACGTKKESLPETPTSTPLSETAAPTVLEEKKSSEDWAAALFPTEETSNAITAEADDYVAGSIENDAYKSEWLNLMFQCPEDASFLNSDNNEYEMYCQYDDNSAAVFVAVSDLPKDVEFFQQYLTALEKKITASTEADYKVLNDKNEAKIGSDTYHAIIFSAKNNNALLYQTYFVRIMGNKVVNIVITYSGDSIEKAQEMISLFNTP